KARRQLIFQSLMTTGPVERAVPVDLPLSARNELHQPWWPQMAFIEHRLANDPTNWWAPNAAAVPALLRASGLRIVQEVGNEIYLCAPATDHSTGADAAHRAEFLAATGQQDGACAGGEFSYSQGCRNGVPDH
ncbi:MAG: hypothetical protein KDE31_35350, partial [Caldilineaceae bacterium]|nr:hypothetical protein [Caldilineaceae bacterium]